VRCETSLRIEEEVEMTKEAKKEIPWEQQRDMLIEMTALKLPLLHQNLIDTYGEEKGRTVYNEIYEKNIKKRVKQFDGKDIGDIMMAEVSMFPALGWVLRVEKKEEGGAPVWYEHLSKCPHLDATKKLNLPLPCTVVCDMDVRMAEKYQVGKWERLKHMPSGDSECCFKIKRYK
jgi:hypothetical protein